MNKIILLDSTPLGLVSNPRGGGDNDACSAWMRGQLANGVPIAIPEIADYEVRRELLRAGKTRGIAKLDALKTILDYLPLTTSTMLRAAEFWAQARRQGRPTANNLKLDADVILAAQASLLLEEGYEAIVATENVSHLSLFVAADRWQNIA